MLVTSVSFSYHDVFKSHRLPRAHPVISFYKTTKFLTCQNSKCKQMKKIQVDSARVVIDCELIRLPAPCQKQAIKQEFSKFEGRYSKSGGVNTSKLGLANLQYKPWFLRVCSASLLETLWEKEKLLITSNFSFSHSVFCPF